MARKTKVEFNIEIPSWDKHQSDRTSTWFKIRNDIFMDTKFAGLSSLAKCLLLLLWSLRARENTSRIQVDDKFLSSCLQVRPVLVRNAYSELLEKQLVIGDSCTKNAPREDKIRRDKIREEKSSAGEVSKKPPKKNKKPKVSTQKFISAWIDGHRSRFGEQSRPLIDGKSQGIAKRLVENLSEPEAISLVTAYFKMEDKWFHTKAYDLATFEQNTSKVHQWMQNPNSIKNPSKSGPTYDVDYKNDDDLDQFIADSQKEIFS